MGSKKVDHFVKMYMYITHPSKAIAQGVIQLWENTLEHIEDNKENIKC